MGKPRSQVFISYTGSTARDRAAARAMAAVLRKMPESFLGRHAVRVYLDAEEQAHTNQLESAIIAGELEKSDYLVYIASPDAARRSWVELEVGTWLKLGRQQGLVVVVATGRVEWDAEAKRLRSNTGSLPPSLMDVRWPEEPMLQRLTELAEAELDKERYEVREVASRIAGRIHDRSPAELLGGERTVARRRLQAAIAAVLMILGLLVAAVWLWRDASQANAVAQARLRDAKRTADTVLFALEGRLYPLVGSADLREELVAETQRLVTSLSASVAADADLEWQRMVALTREAELRRGRQKLVGASVGQLANAEASLLAARQLGLGLIERNPSSMQYQLALATIEASLAELALQRGDATQARELSQLALTRAQTLAATSRDDAAVLATLAAILGTLAEVEQTANSLVLASSHAERALALSRDVEAVVGRTRDSRHATGMALGRAAMVAEAGGHMDRAYVYSSEAAQILHELVATDPDAGIWSHQLAARLLHHGELALLRGALDVALDAAVRAVGLLERLAAVDPRDDVVAGDLAEAYRQFGDVVRAAHRPDASGSRRALEAYELGRARRARLAAKDPANIGWGRGLHVLHERVGDVHLELNDIAEAWTAYAAQRAVIEDLVARDPSNVVLRRDLAASFEREALVGPPALAASTLRHAIDTRWLVVRDAAGQGVRDLATLKTLLVNYTQLVGVDRPGWVPDQCRRADEGVHTLLLQFDAESAFAADAQVGRIRARFRPP